MSDNFPVRKDVHGATALCRDGWIFITMVTKDRQPVFIGDVKILAEKNLEIIPQKYPGWTVDTPIIMPDHLHMILISNNNSEHSLSSVIQGYKSLFYHLLRQKSGISIPSPWQRGYYDKIINSTRALEKIRAYILANPDVEHGDLVRACL